MVTEAAAISQPVRSRGPGWSSLWIAVLLAVAIALPFLFSGYHTLQATQIVNFAIALLGLNLLTGFSGQISLGNGAFWALGSYTAVILMGKAGVPYWVTPPISGALCFGVGYLFGRTATRLEGLYLALATFGLAVATPPLLKLEALQDWTGGSQGVVLSHIGSPLPEHLTDDQWLYFFCLAIAIVLFVGAGNLVRGRTGRALVALRDHPIAAGTMGIDTVAYKSVTFGISAMYTGIAGAMAAIVTGFVSPDSFGAEVSIKFLVGSVLGGIASIFGTIFGAAFIELAPDWAKKISDSAPDALYGILLIICMLVMPRGVAGLVKSSRTWLVRRLGHRTRT